MSLKNINSLLVVAALALALVSCKEEDTTTTPYLLGLSFDCPSYVAPGQVVRMEPKGITHPEGEEVGYYWRVTPTMTHNDTTDLFVHWFSDTLGTYKVTCYAFAAGYAGDSFIKEVQVVKGGLDGSVTGLDIEASDKKISVDGIDYYYETIGGLDWFRTNLMNPQMGAPYVNLEVTSDVFGRYYNHEEAMTACPEGWRLPTEADWMSMASEFTTVSSEKYSSFIDVASKFLANSSFNGETILEYWPEVGDVTNESGLSIVPTGYANLGDVDSEGKYPGALFEGMFEYAAFWTADEVADEEGMAYYRYLISDQPDMFVGKGSVESFGASVRCVRESK